MWEFTLLQGLFPQRGNTHKWFYKPLTLTSTALKIRSKILHKGRPYSTLQIFLLSPSGEKHVVPKRQTLIDNEVPVLESNQVPSPRPRPLQKNRAPCHRAQKGLIQRPKYIFANCWSIYVLSVLTGPVLGSAATLCGPKITLFVHTSADPGVHAQALFGCTPPTARSLCLLALC